MPLRDPTTRTTEQVDSAVVGEETMVACHGDPAPDAHTVFELGSITKTFTALLLACSRCLVGWCEFSARLFRYWDWRCSTEGRTSRCAAL
jgi:hypothetical protein